MSKSRFVNTAARELVKLELSDEDWVQVKARLTNREQRHIDTAGLGGMSGSVVDGSSDSKLDIDWAGFEFARVATYVVDWSFKDDNGKDVECNKANLSLLDSDSFNEIKAALDRYIEAKNSPPGESSDEPGETKPTS